MKRVACLSTMLSSSRDPTSSSQVIDLFNSTIALNSERQITGAFVVSNDFLLLIMEGDATHLGNVIFKIRHDERVKDFSLVLNAHIETPRFTNWGIKIIRQDVQNHHGFLRKLDSIFKNAVDLKTEIDKERMAFFLPVGAQTSTKKTNSAEAESTESSAVPDQTSLSAIGGKFEFSNCTVSLSSWPKPGKLKLNPELIKICARLVGKPQRFEALVGSGIVDSESTLNRYLVELNKLGLLRKHKTVAKPKLVGIDGGLTMSPKTSTPDKFSLVLRKFLSASKS